MPSSREFDRPSSTAATIDALFECGDHAIVGVHAAPGLGLSTRPGGWFGDLNQVGHVDASLAEEALDCGDAPPVELAVAMDDAIPVGAATLEHLDAAGPVGRLHRDCHHGLHLADVRPAQSWWHRLLRDYLVGRMRSPATARRVVVTSFQ
jgi:hypothetical protein